MCGENSFSGNPGNVDELGRDILSRLIYGSRISMLVGSCVVAASLALGLIVGSLAGGEHLGADQPGVANPASERERQP